MGKTIIPLDGGGLLRMQPAYPSLKWFTLGGWSTRMGRKMDGHNRSSNRFQVWGCVAVRATGVMGVVLGFLLFPPAAAKAQGTAPTPELEPPFVECCKSTTDFANLRAGPNAVDYPIVGILTKGEKCKALGRSKAGQWIQIAYLSALGNIAWVNADLVIIHYGAGDLPVIEAPPTQIPKNKPTLDPTFAAEFSSVLPTRLPTFTPATPPPTVSLPAFGGTSSGGGLPAAMIILALLTVGTFGTIFSAIVGRR